MYCGAFSYGKVGKGRAKKLALAGGDGMAILPASRFAPIGPNVKGVAMPRAARQSAVAAAKALVCQCNDPAAIDALCCRMQTQAVAARMRKQPWLEQEARQLLAVAERRLAELRATM